MIIHSRPSPHPISNCKEATKMQIRIASRWQPSNQATKAEAKEMARAGTLSTTTDFIILAKFFDTVLIFKIKNIIIIIIVIIKIVDLHAIS